MHNSSKSTRPSLARSQASRKLFNPANHLIGHITGAAGDVLDKTRLNVAANRGQDIRNAAYKANAEREGANAAQAAREAAAKAGRYDVKGETGAERRASHFTRAQQQSAAMQAQRQAEADRIARTPKLPAAPQTPAQTMLPPGQRLSKALGPSQTVTASGQPRLALSGEVPPPKTPNTWAGQARAVNAGKSIPFTSKVVGPGLEPKAGAVTKAWELPAGTKTVQVRGTLYRGVLPEHAADNLARGFHEGRGEGFLGPGVYFSPDQAAAANYGDVLATDVPNLTLASVSEDAMKTWLDQHSPRWQAARKPGGNFGEPGPNDPLVDRTF